MARGRPIRPWLAGHTREPARSRSRVTQTPIQGDTPVVAYRTCACQSDYCAHHIALRKAWEPVVLAGQASCWRCGKPIEPGQWWDLGHDDHDRTLYRGPECRPCNRSTSGRRSRQARWEL